MPNGELIVENNGTDDLDVVEIPRRHHVVPKKHEMEILVYCWQASQTVIQQWNPFKPEFTIVIFIHYKPRIAVEFLDL